VKYWGYGFVISIVFLIICLLFDFNNPSEEVLKNTHSMVYEQMTTEQQKAIHYEQIFDLLEVVFTVTTITTIGGMVYSVYKITNG